MGVAVEMATVLNVGSWLVVLGTLLVLRRQQRGEWGRAQATTDEVLARIEAVASAHRVTQQDLANFERGVMTRLGVLLTEQ